MANDPRPQIFTYVTENAKVGYPLLVLKALKMLRADCKLRHKPQSAVLKIEEANVCICTASEQDIDSSTIYIVVGPSKVTEAVFWKGHFSVLLYAVTESAAMANGVLRKNL